MRRLLGPLGAAIAVGGLLAAPVFASSFLQAAQGLAVGDQAPDFKLQGSDGKTYSLSELKGKTVVLAWFPKAFTAG